MAGCFGNNPEDRARQRELNNYLDAGGRLDTCKSYAKSALIPEYLEIGELVRRPLPPQNSKEGETK